MICCFMLASLVAHSCFSAGSDCGKIKRIRAATPGNGCPCGKKAASRVYVGLKLRGFSSQALSGRAPSPDFNADEVSKSLTTLVNVSSS